MRAENVQITAELQNNLLPSWSTNRIEVIMSYSLHWDSILLDSIPGGHRGLGFLLQGSGRSVWRYVHYGNPELPPPIETVTQGTPLFLSEGWNICCLIVFWKTVAFVMLGQRETCRPSKATGSVLGMRLVIWMSTQCNTQISHVKMTDVLFLGQKEFKASIKEKVIMELTVELYKYQ